MSKIRKVLLTGKTHTTFASRAGRVDLKLSTPNDPKAALNFDAVQAHPTAEQLFAGAWSACYISAVELVAKERNITLPAGFAVDLEVDLGVDGDAYLLQARLGVRLPGLAQDVAEQLAHDADKICPYSKATRGNIDVDLSVTTA
jgi:Ohr subfamily peroxiredoxin